MLNKKKFIALILSFLLLCNSLSFAEVVYNENSVDMQAVETTQESRYPDYAKMYVGEDKHEQFNRKMFNLNSKLNKFVARPVHILWSSIMPKFGIDRIRDAYNNIEYPKRLISCILQRDGEGVKIETKRFLTNTTLGLGGLFDPADKIFKIKPTNENMEQALCKCKMGSGSYLVMPVLNACTPRSICGRALEAALDPTVYLASPITSAIKFGLMLNRTSYMQPLAKMIETTYADPYDIHKKLFGIENYIRNANLDREDLVTEEKQLVEEGHPEIAEELVSHLGEDSGYKEAGLNASDLSDILPLGKNVLRADIVLDGYNPQSPVVDSMRTSLFENPEINKSMWNELSIWNRSFAKRIKTGSVEVTDGRDNYKFKYILQKDKTSPLIILYPSIGEGAGAHHSIVFAKIFYDLGYSVVMQGSHFHWEFVKSMPQGYSPGIPYNDAKQVRLVTSKILDYLNKKYDCSFREKTVVGTSFGAMAALYLAQNESEENTLGITKYIAISPPIELKYALEQIDKNGDEFDKNSDEVKQKTAITAAKILQLVQLKDAGDLNFQAMPFSEEEGKLITTFIMRQKLSDIIFTIENVPKNKKTDIYNLINNMSYKDYAEKYLSVNFNEPVLLDEKASLFAISDYLQSNDNYKIYQSMDDYLINKSQIIKLKDIAGNHLVCLNCGSHLGFLYRKEFEEALINDIKNGS
ncbi:VacJ family lipoprotein [bacterium]|nr:VacJ family lipoprotein [bacterium]